jgi:hypothetical protein
MGLRWVRSVFYFFAGVTVATIGANRRIAPFIIGILLLVTCMFHLIVLLLESKLAATKTPLSVITESKIDVMSSPFTSSSGESKQEPVYFGDEFGDDEIVI